MSQGAPIHRPTAPNSPQDVSRRLVIVLAVAAAIGAGFAGAHPTATAFIDPLETAVFAGGFTLLTSRSPRWMWLVLGVAVVLLARDWLLVPAVITMAGAFSSVFSSRVSPPLGAAIGALGVQVMLRWPPAVFHGFPGLVAAAVLGLMAGSTWSQWPNSTQRRILLALVGFGVVAIVVCLPAVISVLLARHEAEAAAEKAEAALSSIGSGNSSLVTTELNTAALDAARAADTLGSWFDVITRVVPLVAQQDRFLTGTTQAAAQATRVGALEAPLIDYHMLDYHDGRIDLSRLRAMAIPMQILDRQLGLTARALHQVDSPWLVGPLQTRARSFGRDVSRALRGANLAVEAAKVLPAMLGADGQRTYFVAFMTPSESRGYDGFIGSYGILTAVAGRVRLTVSGSIADIEAALPAGGARLTGLRDFLVRYGAFHPGEFPQDATYPPDLPTVAQVLDQIYRQSGGVPLDGVLALDPEGLAALLHFTGPIEVAGLPIPLTETNAASVLLTQQYTTFDAGTTGLVESPADLLRHDFLQGALKVAFDKLVTGSLPAPKVLASVLKPAVTAGRISFWSFHQDEQTLLRQLGIDGVFPSSDGGDLLALTTQNSGNNKIDAYLHTTMADQLTFDPSSGSVHSVVTVHLTNDAPSSGLPPIVIASPADPTLPTGTNRTWLTLYSPLAVTKVSLDGRSSGVSSTKELGVYAYSMYVNVPPDGVATVKVNFAGVVDARVSLPITVRLQPSVNPETVAVQVTPVPGWQLASPGAAATWVLSSATRQRRVFRFVPG